MSSPQFRQDPITGRWVIIAADRSARPQDYTAAPDRRANEDACPFCEGQEHQTPAEVLAFRHEHSQPDAPGWRVRVVPNKYPALVQNAIKPVNAAAPGPSPLCVALPGQGLHEVIVESPRHVVSPTELSVEEVAEGLAAYAARLRTLRGQRQWKYALVFKNVGAAAGASLEHTHSQLLATPFVPTVVQQELEGAEGYYRTHRRCIYCAMIDDEVAGGTRLVRQTANLLAFCPYASRFGYETWIAPRGHQCRFEESTPSLLVELADMLRDVLAAVERAIDPPAYNLVIHTAPFDTNALPHYHWHVEILPSLTTTAGFEWGSGIHINPMPPEDAAKQLGGRP
jgi:UDPglucose--hexose-1-phosphate uridylyltransferase